MDPRVVEGTVVIDDLEAIAPGLSEPLAERDHCRWIAGLIVDQEDLHFEVVLLGLERLEAAEGELDLVPERHHHEQLWTGVMCRARHPDAGYWVPSSGDGRSELPAGAG